MKSGGLFPLDTRPDPRILASPHAILLPTTTGDLHRTKTRNVGRIFKKNITLDTHERSVTVCAVPSLKPRVTVAG
jgi:hypothetical protein